MRTKYKEIPAKGQEGFLLYCPYTKCHFFRIYHGKDFTDYAINAEEVEIQIIGDWTSLYESENSYKLDFSSKALGK